MSNADTLKSQGIIKSISLLLIVKCGAFKIGPEVKSMTQLNKIQFNSMHFTKLPAFEIEFIKIFQKYLSNQTINEFIYRYYDLDRITQLDISIVAN